MRLEPLYRIRFTYPEGWEITLGGDWEQHFYLAEGQCEGKINGRFRGANYPQRSGDGTFGYQAGISDTGNGDQIQNNNICGLGYANSAANPGFFAIDTSGASPSTQVQNNTICALSTPPSGVAAESLRRVHKALFPSAFK